MPAVKLNIVIEEGATFQMVVDATRHTGSLSGATAKMQIRESRASEAVLLEATPVVDAIAKTVTLTIPYAETTGLLWDKGQYDMEMTIGVVRYRLVEGYATVSREVTRS